MGKLKKVAIVYHYSALYRYAVFHELSKCNEFDFTLVSDNQSDNDIKTIDPKFAEMPIEEGGIRWRFVKNVWLNGNKFLWQKSIVRICLKEEFDIFILLGNPYYISTWLAALILRMKGKKVYYWTHGLLKKEHGAKWLMRKAFLKLASGIMLYGHHAERILLEEGFSKNKLHVIYNSLDYFKQAEIRESITESELSDLKKSLFKNPELPQLVFVGRLTKQKKLHFLIEVTNTLIKEGYLINLLFIGDGTEMSSLKDIVQQKGIDEHVHFYGASYDELSNGRLIKASDICVSPGEVGLTAMHSLGYGTPVITHDNFEEQMPEFEAIQDGISGAFFEQNNLDSLCETIKLWFERNTDRELTRNRCIEVMEQKYNPKTQTDLICNVLKN